MPFQRLLLAAALALPSTPVFANCETGAYLIHTLAEYKPYEPSRVVLWYAKAPGGRLDFSRKHMDVESHFLAAFTDPSLRLEHEAASCTGHGVTSVERYDERHDVVFRLDTPSCRGLFENLPSRGYAFLDTQRQVLSFLGALAVGVAPLAEHDRASLSAQIEAQLAHLPLYAESGPGGREGRGRIETSQIRGVRVETTTVGFGREPFVLAIAVLELSGVDGLYDLSWIGERLPVRLRAEDRVEYPVIFFRRPGGSPVYAGDGSWCASVRVGDLLGRGFRPPAERRPDVPLGAAERFRLTGAFDANADGAPDVLEVNDVFAYLLEPDGRFFVARYAPGC